ncbi:MAG: 3-oxoacyl-ACP reductase FabG [Alphaproteobacteria bacterium]|nr:3-oxoacyl-ACP reductase FabG [Alphaproteobacteria bacterium]MDA8001769.1 3-oxoacyl-ACP reductase FabG [Alphaproteobacteria bacterium]MDA8003849.1 3-oxoacyl-ACP reductase FabG [Alphaproteobacteria bacterium]MDA8005739.1 3-oxoacyl-ACP reductase FabG [Alphaproteobacteria bacterium]MDA8013084.1 3-oxoacyl-ACP reductase FabG [Alphaproteobacteria bacterium]
MTNIPEEFSLHSQRALITGASGGIGAQIAQTLAKYGAQIAVSGRNHDKLQHLIATLPANNHQSITADLANPDDANSLVTRANEKLGGNISILVNNAGLTHDSLSSRLSPENWNEIIGVNLTATFLLSRAALRAMSREKYGRVISISSIVASIGNPAQANYTAAKAGIEGLSRTLAREYASRGITVNCVAPGFIETPMTENLPEATRENFLRQIPLQRPGAPADVAAACLFLASPAAGWVTGQTLHINGGMFMT